MKTLVATLLTAATAIAETVLPEPFPTERYTAMMEQSPFALATPVAPPPAAPTKGFAADWYVGGLGRYEDQDYVSIKSRDLSVAFALFGNEEVNGVTLVGVEWSNERGKSTVTVKKGGEIARLEFNQAELQAAAPVPAPQQVPGRPIVPGQATARPVITGLPGQQPVINQPVTQQRAGMTIPRPTGAPVVSQPPALPGGTSIANPTTDAGTTDSRRRIRVINAK